MQTLADSASSVFMKDHISSPSTDHIDNIQDNCVSVEAYITMLLTYLHQYWILESGADTDIVKVFVVCFS